MNDGSRRTFTTANEYVDWLIQKGHEVGAEFAKEHRLEIADIIRLHLLVEDTRKPLLEKMEK